MAIPALATKISSLPKSLTTSSIVVCTFAALDTDLAMSLFTFLYTNLPLLTLCLVSFCLDIVLFGQFSSLGNRGIIAVTRSSSHEVRPSPASTTSHLLYHSAISAPASAMASATANPIPSDAPVMATTLPLILNCSSTLEGVSGTGRGCLGVAQSSIVIDIFA